MPLTSKITSPTNSLDHMPKPEVILLVHRCFYHKECTKHYATPQNLREHLKKFHSFTFPIRIQTIRRYNSESFCFLRGFSKHKNFKEHHACPCCVAHLQNLSDLNQHFQTVHKDYLPFQQQQKGSDSSENSSIDRLDQNQDSINTLESQQEESFQEVRQKRSYNEIMIHDDISFDSPHGEHFLVNNFDVSNAIHRMQLSLKEHTWKLSLEDNLHLALASMSVLLLSPNRYPEEVKPFFRQEDWNDTISHVESLYDIKQQPMPITTVASILTVVDDLLSRNTNREQAEARLKSLPLSDHEHKFTKAISALITKLPPIPMEENMNEFELCTRFLDPFLSALFDDPDNGIYLRWTNETTLESKAKSDLSRDRPDICITESCGGKWDVSRGYGEVKPATQIQNHYLICKDLYKIAEFCKNSVNTQSGGSLGIQTIGRDIKFYLLSLPATDAHVLLQLAEIKVPDSLQKLPQLVTEISSVLKVLQVFDKVCLRANRTEECIGQQNLQTKAVPKLQQLFSESKNRKRPCHLQLHHS